MGIRVAEHRYLLQRSVISAQRNRLVGPAKIGTADIEQHTRTGPGNSIGIAFVTVLDSQLYLVSQGKTPLRRRSRLHLEAEAIVDIPTLGFGQVYQDVLIGFIAVGILDRWIDLVKQGQVIEPALHLQQGSLIERGPGPQRDPLLSHRRLGSFHPRADNLAYKAF